MRSRALAAATAVVAAMMLQVPNAAAAEPVHLIAWSPLQLPSKTEAVLDRMDGVRATTVWSGSLFMKSSRVPGGRVVDRRNGYTVPLDVAYVEPNEYARFARPADGAAIRRLDGRRALLARGEVGLRDGEERLRMRFTQGRARSIGSISNASAQGYELIMAQPAIRGSRAFRTVLIEKQPEVDRARIRRRIKRLIDDKPLELSSEREAPFLRHAQRVRPQLLVKKAFGEFRMRPAGGRSISIKGWVGSHIRSDRVPFLGNVRCHRKIFRQLRGAMRELRRRGLGWTVDRDDYAGCFVPRFISSYDGYGIGPARRLSRHSWGIALDINASSNRFGTRGNQPRPLIRVMKKWGFSWGGRWALPDPMHFEWERFER